MINFREQIQQAVEATVFHSPSWFSWFDKETVKMPVSILRTISADEVRSLILMALQLQLYENFYCPGMALAATDSIPLQEIQTQVFTKRLRAANCGRGFAESEGWEITNVRKNKVSLEREGLRLSANTSQLIRPRKSYRHGATATLRSGQVLSALSPGFHMTVGDKDWSLNSTKPLNRFYWNLSVPGAAPFVRAVTSILNAAKLPFRVKVANHPGQFRRCDAGVVYIPTDSYELVEKLIARIYLAVSTHLKRGTPALTKELSPGLGWAEDPGADSFGLSRCSLIAEGILRACERGKNGLTDRLDIVEARFDEAGVSLEKPFLNPGSRAGQQFNHFADQVIGASREFSHCSRERGASSRSLSNRTLFLKTAQEIGRQLIAEAFWDGDLCNWLGAMQGPANSNEPNIASPQGPLGPDFSSGTSGVALFLAELSALTGDSAARRTALGAIRSSLSRVDAIPPEKLLGLHDGFVGIALAAARVSTVAKNDELLKSTSRMLKRTLGEFRTVRGDNFVAGKAGAISGLLAIRRILPDDVLLATATCLGDSLSKVACHAATIRRSRPGPADKFQQFPTGFSQGLSGMAYALVELFSATRNADYGRAAMRLIAIEEKTITRVSQPPSGHRLSGSGQSREGGEFADEISWSHGAAGIALARIRAYEILRDQRLRLYAAPAIRATRLTLENWLRVARGNFSLARGIVGNAEVLLRAREVFGCEYDADRSLVFHVARDSASDLLATEQAHWAYGINDAPGLMPGLAGIGHFFVRLSEPSVASSLCLAAEDHHACPILVATRRRRP